MPDVYQGTEGWDFSFADPDNRRPVDFARRAETLARVKDEIARGASAAARTFLGDVGSGAVKTMVLAQALRLRRERPAAFESARYEGCAVHGALARHVIAFTRGEPGRRVMAVGGRLFARLTATGVDGALGAAWGDGTAQLSAPLPNAQYREALTDRPVKLVAVNGGQGFLLRDLFADLPVALIEEVA